MRSNQPERRRKVPREQLWLDRHQWGGRRPGAGRPKEKGAGVPHAMRASMTARYPLHVTAKLRSGLPSLRRGGALNVVMRSFRRGCKKAGFRLVHYSIQSNHLHLLVEGSDRERVVRGLQGLFVRIAKGLNRHWVRKGSVFADRYHDVVLKTPRQVRNALRYILFNDRKHGFREVGRAARRYGDPCASGKWFDGWRGLAAFHDAGVDGSPVARARTWLVTKGWRRHGLLVPDGST